jgi:ribonuclease E
MPKTMLIDAGHQEETRVAVCQGGKVEDFDFEYASRKPLRGNIYLARVTRVEPSLQAAFIEYGGNRHGFLAFGEIHPDYYQIPVADRDVLRKAEALEMELAQKLAERDQDDDDIDPDEDNLGRGSDALDDDAAAEAAGDERADDNGDDNTNGSLDEEDAPDFVAPTDNAEDEGDWHAADEDLIEAMGEAGKKAKPSAGDGGEEEEEEEEQGERRNGSAALETSNDDALVSEDAPQETDDSDPVIVRSDREGDPEEGVVADEAEAEASSGDKEAEAKSGDADDADDKPAAKGSEPETPQTEQELRQLRARYEEAKRDRNRLLRAYKIQEVIKRRQIMLVQVVKEERGNKGAALTTYLSLAGRYGVLMPNTARGGGISRKITSQADRKRLKKAMSELDIPQNMGLIIRTAGAKRTKVEIKRDYDYLSRLWEQIREKTLDSVAPCLIYEEASLIKRAIRDLYDKDTETIHVQGEGGYREAKDFMKMLMPSHAKYVQRHKGDQPIFLKHKVEEQLDGMYQPTVQLKSGGYIVIQQTEALVSIDVNSGRSTKERNVEQTALKTNSEAAVEVARQCRLRDLAGLIVIDFIDMEENRNNRAVEKKLKEAMKTDRARTQIGSISTFGLLEMSRQRRRSGIVDGTTQACPICDGAGHVRSHEMAALRILRAAEGVAATGRHGLVTVKTSTEVALYILNTKRTWLERIESVNGVKTNVLADSGKFGDQYEVQGTGAPNEAVTLRETIGDEGPLSDFDAPELPGEDKPESQEKSARVDSDDDDDKPKRRRRRRRRKGSNGEGQDGQESSSNNDADSSDDDAESDSDADEAKSADGSSDDDSQNDGARKKRRRGRRGGRRNRRTGQGSENGEGAENGEDGDDAKADDAEGDAPSASDGKPEAEPQDAGAGATGGVSAEEAAEQPEAKPKRSRNSRPSRKAKAEPAPEETKEDEAAEPANEPAKAEETAAEEPAAAGTEVAEPSVSEAQAEPEAEPQQEPPVPSVDDAPQEPRRVGWWQRAFQKN